MTCPAILYSNRELDRVIGVRRGAASCHWPGLSSLVGFVGLCEDDIGLGTAMACKRRAGDGTGRYDSVVVSDPSLL